MNCELAEETILDVARGMDIDSGARSGVLLHTAECAGCAARLADQLALTDRLHALARAWEPSGAAEGLEEAVLASFRANRTVPIERRAPNLLWAAVGIAAGLALAMLWLPGTTVHTPVLRTDPVAERPPATATLPLDLPVSQKIGPRRARTGAPASTLAAEKASVGPLPHGRGSVNCCKHKAAIPSRARQQAIYRLFQQPARAASSLRTTAPSSHASPRETFATEFFALPHAPAFAPEDGVQLVRVRLPRASLRSFGLLMDETRTAGRVQADVLLGQDGIARAIRFVQ